MTSQTNVRSGQVLDGSLKNVDVASDAAIAFSKLAALTSAKILVGDGSNVVVAVSLSGDLTITNAGVATIANSAIIDAKVSAAAAIAYTKLAGAAGVDAAFAAVAAAATASAQAGQAFTIAASSAVAGSSNAGAAAGGAVAVNAGNAAYLTSGNAAGGSVTLTAGAGVNSGNGGNVTLTGGSAISGTSGSIYLNPGSGGVAGAVVVGGVAVGIQTALLKVVTNTTGIGQVLFGQASADADSFDILYQKARGTTVSPTVITTADELGTIQWMGHSGAGGYVVGAAIKAFSSGTIATTRVPGELRFYTGTDAAPTVLTEQIRITNAGRTGIGTTTPGTGLEVKKALGLGGSSVTLSNGDNNNVAIGDKSYIRITGPSGAFAITGFASSTDLPSGSGLVGDGHLLIIFNDTAQTMTIKNQNVSSTSGNRIFCPGLADKVLSTRDGAIFIYDALNENVWVLIAGF